MKRNLTAIAALLLLCLALAACGQTEATANPGQEAAESLTTEEQAAYQERIIGIYAPATEHFGLEQTDGSCFVNFQFDDTITTEETLGLHRHLSLREGDTVPVFFWSADTQAMTVLVKDSEGSFTRYTFQRAEAPDLSQDDFGSCWVQTQEPEVWTPV